MRLERTQAIDEMVERFRAGTTELPRDARRLGGRVADGSGAYYRELLAPQRTLEQDAHRAIGSRAGPSTAARTISPMPRSTVGPPMRSRRAPA